MNKIEVYDNVVEREEEPLRNFLDGLLYLDEFSAFYDIIKSFKFEFEVLGTFKYSDDRETLEETMKLFQIKVKDNSINEDNIKEIMDLYISDDNLNIDYTYEDSILTIKLL